MGHGITNELIAVLACKTRDELLAIIKGSPFVGVLIDEATDCANLAQLVIYYKLLDPDGKPVVVHAGLEKLPNGTADSVFAAVRHRLQKDGIHLSKVLSFGSDGASVMLGSENGVATQLLRLPIHCVLHREALACKMAAEEIRYVNLSSSPAWNCLVVTTVTPIHAPRLSKTPRRQIQPSSAL